MSFIENEEHTTRCLDCDVIWSNRNFLLVKNGEKKIGYSYRVCALSMQRLERSLVRCSRYLN